MYFCVFGFLKRHIIKQIGDMMLYVLFLHASQFHGFFSLVSFSLSFYLFFMKLCSKIDKRNSSYTLDNMLSSFYQNISQSILTLSLPKYCCRSGYETCTLIFLPSIEADV
jgi:hypothetical protein